MMYFQKSCCDDKFLIGKVFCPSEGLKDSYDSFLKEYNRNLRCKWNTEVERWEIWEQSPYGDFRVSIVSDEEGRFREIDLRDILELESRSISRQAFRRETVDDSVDNHNADNEFFLDKSFSDNVKSISVDIFNKTMDNPVVTGV